MDKVFGIIPASSGTFMFLWGLGILIAIIFTVTIIMSDYRVINTVVTIFVFSGLIGLFSSFGYQAKHAVFTITERGLKIGPGIYGRFIPKEKIRVERARVIDLNMEKEYKPKWRMNGAGLPGYLAGWFKLNNKEKALMFVTDYSSIIYVPTTDKYSVMLSVREADVMVQAIQQWKY